MLTEGHCIAHYRILRLLGEGGMGRDGCSQGPRAEATHQHATSAGIQMPPQAIMAASSPKGLVMSLSPPSSLVALEDALPVVVSECVPK